MAKKRYPRYLTITFNTRFHTVLHYAGEVPANTVDIDSDKNNTQWPMATNPAPPPPQFRRLVPVTLIIALLRLQSTGLRIWIPGYLAQYRIFLQNPSIYLFETYTYL